ncbi:MAG: TIGR00296 family protein [Methanomassiliicoccales archaeon]|nr:TIGR00296 family protein [Methanomassiliicoccales archaeon]
MHKVKHGLGLAHVLSEPLKLSSPNLLHCVDGGLARPAGRNLVYSWTKLVPMNDSEGETAVGIARKTIEAEASDEEPGRLDAPDSFRQKRGVFVTIHTHPQMDLRGCIGYPEPVFSLGKALIKAAQGACHDPRFPYLRREELEHIIVEVSILTVPEEIKVESRKELPSKVQVGRDGLIVEMGYFRGLLLPQVASEWGWDAETFLAQTCVKAGLTPDCWLDKRSKVYGFQAEIFTEEVPRGKTMRKELK